jgi:uncharacterized RDD family membrane protein YckC
MSEETETNPFAPPEADLAPFSENPFRGDFKPAPFSLRFAASLMDVVIVETVLSLCFVAFMIMLSIMETQADEISEAVLPFAAIVLFMTMLGAPVLYGILCDCSIHGATLGKRMAKLKVVDLTGRQISFGAAIHRNVWKCLLIGFLMQPLTPKRQALHDILAGTLVVKL